VPMLAGLAGVVAVQPLLLGFFSCDDFHIKLE
jgi:hypothetical protein